MTRTLLAGVLGVMVMSASVGAQDRRPASPSGTAATEVSGSYVPGGDAPVYRGGKWIEITYGRPIKRGRDLWGSGADYGKTLNAGSPVWRAGANTSTRLKTEVPLVINGKTVAPGEYSLFIDLKPDHWTLIVSSWGAQRQYNSADKDALWGSFGYTPDKDVARAPMILYALPHSVDELAWEFLDMSNAGGVLAISWDKVMARVPFTIPR